MKLKQKLYIILLITMVTIIIALFNLQVIEGSKYEEIAVNNYVKKKTVEGNRGEIFDRNGVPLAQNYPATSLTVIPGFISDKDSLFSFLQKSITIERDEFDKFLHDTRFRRYNKNVLLNNLNREEVSLIAENLNYFPELDFKIENTRHYHFPNHYLGFIGRINQEEYKKLKKNNYHYNSYIGKTGIEKQYETILRGTDGVKLNLRDAGGKDIRLFSHAQDNPNNYYIPPEDGYDLYLTIDSRLQSYTDSLFIGKRGAAVAMDYTTGEVLAYVSAPEFDQNIFMKRIPNHLWKSIQADTLKPMLDRVSKAKYPPGSIFKIIPAAYGLEEKVIAKYTKLKPCTGGLMIGNRFVKCWKHSGHGRLNVIDALKVSCDVFFYDLSFRFDLDSFYFFVKDCMLSSKTGIDIPNETKGFFPNSKWYYKNYGPYTSLKGHMVNLSIGQGEMAFSPLQMCALFSGFADKGNWHKPHLLSRAVKNDTTLFYDDFETNSKIKLPISDSSLDIIEEGLRAVVAGKHGTGHAVKRRHRLIYGKTGSAEHKKGRKTHAWFAGYEKNTHLAVCVFLQEGGGGGSVAGPIAGKIFDYYHKLSTTQNRNINHD